MIITKNRQKVKKISISLISKLDRVISLPLKKFILEMCFGMITTGSCNINLIAGKLNESSFVKHTVKRLQRMLLHCKVFHFANKLSLDTCISKVCDESIIALDDGDIVHQYGKKFDKIAPVKDGSSGDIKPGYWLNQASGFNPSTQETFPLQVSIYSTKEKGFKSANNEGFKTVDKVISRIGVKGLWVMDRGYDGGEYFHYFLKNNLNFMIRMNKTRNLIYRDKSVNINGLAKSINRRIRFSQVAKFGSMKVKILVKKKEHEMTLICYKDKRNKEPMIFLTNGWIKSTKELKRRIRGYFHRWGVEVCYRFEKQGFGIEKSKTRNYDRIKTLLGLTLISWLILIKINEQPKLKESVLKNAKMEKDKIKNRPKFIYYRIQRGIQNLFEGIKRLFLFRLKRKQKQEIIKKKMSEMPLFNKLKINDFQLLEEVA